MSGTSTRQGRISFRPRPIDISKPLPIIRHEIEDDESSVSRMVPMLPTGMESQEEEEVHLQEIINAANARTSHDLLPEIPIPVVKIVDGYDTAPNPTPFTHANTYVIHKEKTDEEWDQVTEYDLDDDDEELIATINQSAASGGQAANKKPLITHDKYEFFMDRFEKEYHYFGVCDQAKAEQICKGLKPNIVTQIYQHWVNKRKKQTNSFLRRLLKPPDREDPSPYKAFRAREAADINKQKKARKNDAASLQKMQQLRQEMERARTIMEMIKKREKLKKDHFHVVSQIYDKLVELAQIKSLEQDDLPPPPTPSHHSSNHKKKKDQSTSLGGSTLASLLLQQKHATGPTFSNNDQQPLVISGGKARQEGYRHFIVKHGEYPTPSLEKQYSTKPDTPSLESTTIDLTQPNANPPSTSTSTPSTTTIPTPTPTTTKTKEEKEAIDYYFDSISAPTSSNYYDDSDESDDSADESDFDTDINTNHAISLVPPTQPRMNAKGQPIYPSCNKGYIFISPKHPPLLGRARVGRYGGTYIDFLPVAKKTLTPSKVSFNSTNNNSNNNLNNNNNNSPPPSQILSPSCNNNNNQNQNNNSNLNNNSTNIENNNSNNDSDNTFSESQTNLDQSLENNNNNNIENVDKITATTTTTENINVESLKNENSNNIVNMETSLDSIAPAAADTTTENRPQSPSSSLKRKQPDPTIDDSGNDTDTDNNGNSKKNNSNLNNTPKKITDFNGFIQVKSSNDPSLNTTPKNNNNKNQSVVGLKKNNSNNINNSPTPNANSIEQYLTKVPSSTV
ncbi:hypothetical protein CYY_000505 [Polysphondylium violaceum]|uniref:Enhancer of polycomb-like protein n=1 Tax=Polysphondylium violaceum TaxID=133409 RepID=A0A8J4Q2Q4_9MYCE|nr:hypothetical protein CYY_000505 [Polysphondylium violaceum]